MWNLKIQNKLRIPLTLSETENVVNSTSNFGNRICSNISSSGCYIYTDVDSTVHYMNSSVAEKICFRTKSNVVQLFSSSESNELLIVYGDGYIRTYDAEHNEILSSNPVQKYFEDCDFMVVCASMSPMCDITCLIVRKMDNSLWMFLCYWNTFVDQDPIRIGLESTECSVQNVNVGWGKKSTQFHGSLGRQAALSNPAQASPISADFDVDDDGSVTAVWRADGEYLVVNSVNQHGVRQLFVYDRNGTLYSRTHLDLTLTPFCSWKPNNEHIACCCFLKNEICARTLYVAFFEKNGLEHGDRLKLIADKVFNLTYNKSGDLLAVGIVIGRIPSILFYSRTNYRWYIKNQFNYSEYSAQIPLFIFDDELFMVTHCLLRKFTDDLIHHYERSQLKKAYDTSSSSNRIHTVVDSRKIDISPFGYMILPPPMCAFSLNTFNDDVKEVKWFANYLFVLTTKQNVFFWKEISHPHRKSLHDSLLVHSGVWELAVKEDVFNFSLRLKNDDWIEAVSLTSDHPTALVFYQFKHELKTNVLYLTGLQFVECCPFSSTTDKITDLIFEENTLLVVLNETIVYIMEPFDFESIPMIRKLCNLRRTLVDFSLHCRIIENQLLIFTYYSQLKDLHIYCGDHLKHILSPTLSYFIGNRFLIITTKLPGNETGEGIRIIRLDDLLMDSILTECYRPVEYGAEIIMSLPSTNIVYAIEKRANIHLLLQMPRGNIELITPRIFIINEIIRLLKPHHFKDAFELALSHRVDLNVLCDYDLKDFLENCNEFLYQLKEPKLINTFLTALVADNVFFINGIYSKLPYINIYRSGENVTLKTSEKVQTICSSIAMILEQLTEKNNQRKYLSCLVNCDIMGGEKGQGLCKSFTRLQKYKIDQSSSGSTENDDSVEDSIDDAFKTIFQRASEDNFSSEDLFNLALGTYELDLALSLVKKTNMDPKKYLDLLNNFKSYFLQLEANIMKYKIDMYLHRYESALVHLLHSKSLQKVSDEVLELVRRHALFSQCLSQLNLLVSEEKDNCWILNDQLKNDVRFTLMKKVSIM